MAEKLSVIIALEGAEEIKRQLADVGQAGKDCFNEINKAAAEVGGFNKLDTSQLGEGLVAAGVAGKDVAKVLTAVKQAGRMETLVNGIAAVEKGFAKAGAAVGEFGKAVGFVLPSVKTMARLLVVAFGAAVVGAIVSATKALLEFDAQAIKLGVSLADLAKAQEIFKQLGVDSKTAAQGVADFFEKMQLDKVKEAIAALDEFGRPLRTNIDAMRILREALNGSGEAAELARQALKKFGELPPPSRFADEIDRIKQSAASAPNQLLAMFGVFEKMGNTAERNRLIFANFSKELATAIIQLLNAGVPIQDIKSKLDGIPAPTGEAAAAATRLSAAWEKLKTVIGSPFSVSPGAMDAIAGLLNGISQLATAFSKSNFRANAQAEFAAVVEIVSQAIGYIVTGFMSLPGLIGSAWQFIVQGATTAVQTVLQFFAQMPGQIAGFFAGFGANLWDGIVSSAQTAWNDIVGFIQRAINKAKEFFGMGGGQASGAGAQGMARGGIMGGRGSGTSDSNLAWLSRGEHVMPAYAVRQPGVLQLLEALRRSGGNLRGVLDRMGHFALGGMVGAPTFASGGSVGGMSNVTINFPGLAPISGLRASSVVVDELRRSAALAQVRAGGRKPSRYT